MKLLIFSSAFIFLSVAQAEYRVYQYSIRNLSNIERDNVQYYETSALDPVSFQRFHGGHNIEVNLLRTWMCPGHTGHLKNICRSPYEKLEKALLEADQENQNE